MCQLMAAPRHIFSKKNKRSSLVHKQVGWSKWGYGGEDDIDHRVCKGSTSQGLKMMDGWKCKGWKQSARRSICIGLYFHRPMQRLEKLSGWIDRVEIDEL